jgi:hypothetical protein
MSIVTSVATSNLTKHEWSLFCDFPKTLGFPSASLCLLVREQWHNLIISLCIKIVMMLRQIMVTHWADSCTCLCSVMWTAGSANYNLSILPSIYLFIYLSIYGSTALSQSLAAIQFFNPRHSR